MPILVAMLAIYYATSRSEAATTNDLSANWSDTLNPNGVWSYNEGANPLPHMDCVFSNCAPFTCCLPAWSTGKICPTQGGSTPVIPAWFKVPACDVTNFYDLQAGDVVMHSRDDANGAGNGEGNVTWTAPTNGFVTISGSVWYAHTGQARGNHWSLYHNGTLLTEGDIFDGDAYSRALPFDFRTGSGGSNLLQNISVNAGDTIKLLLAKTSQYGDLAGVNLTVVSAPQPIGGPALRIQLNPGILVYGTMGTTYRIEYVSQAGATNWMTLTNLVLPSSPHLIFDPQPATMAARFYRAVQTP